MLLLNDQAVIEPFQAQVRADGLTAVEGEGRGEFPPADGLWNVILGFEPCQVGRKLK